MLKFTTRGTPYERGFQQGQATRALALPWMEKLLADLTARFGLQSTTRLIAHLCPHLERWRRQLKALYPEGVEECRGLAAGLGVEENAYFSLQFCYRLDGTWPQCTVLGCRDADGRALLGKSDDIYLDELGLNVLETTLPATGFRHLHFHFAATLWTVAGMNECGLAMGMTGIPGPVLEQEGLCSLAALHTVLPSCADVAAALAHIGALRLNAGGFSLVLGDAAGAMALVEKTAAGTVVTRERKMPLVHTNHILDPAFAHRNPAQTEPLGANGRQRYTSALRLARAAVDPAAILAHRAGPGPVCQRGEDGLHTDFAVLMAPEKKQIYLWAGYPDTTAMETLEVDALLA